jgi:NAD(P)-dependent dehydrogenase (short-subunit alcohol dehydrogenase family)
MVDTGLKNKVVCITGANNPRGIGAAAARAFARQDAIVFVHFFRQEPEASPKPLPNEPGEALYRQAQTVSAEDLVKEIKQRGGRADS